VAKIVLGIGTSHTPMLTLQSGEWEHRAAADYQNPSLNLSDGRWLNYEQLLAEVGPRYERIANLAQLSRQADICERSLDRLGATLRNASPDIVLIVGDDQEELFSPANNPAFSVFYGPEIMTNDKYGRPEMPEWMRVVSRGYGMDHVRVFPGAPDFAREIIVGLIDRHIDVGACAKIDQPQKNGFGHAFGFVIKRLFADTSIPVVPILLNTYYAPNVPSAARCHDIGRALREVIDASPCQARVAIVASGGLSHFVVDEQLDRRVLQGFEPGKEELLRSIPRAALNSGSSEILNWILMAGALRGLPLQWLEYQPIYRTPAGTGVGVAFGSWRGE
jgi:Catalytic LigB subunit of aromatic ring-opening dioxygenase